jgi:hypothetical protein
VKIYKWFILFVLIQFINMNKLVEKLFTIVRVK